MSGRPKTVQLIQLVCKSCNDPYFVRPQKINSKYCSVPCRAKGRTTDPTTLFWAKVEKTDSCWLWKGSTHVFGYGSFRGKNGTQAAHRFSYFLTYGVIPEGLCVLHQCDTPACVNPAHLFLGTRGDNIRDAARKGRTAKGQKSGMNTHPEKVKKGSANHFAKFTESDIPKIRAMEGTKSIAEIARNLNASLYAVWAIIRRKTWKHVP